MDTNILLHSIKNVSQCYSLKAACDYSLRKIFDSGYLKTNASRQRTMKTYGFNGNDYVSLCNYRVGREAAKTSQYNSFVRFIMESPSLIFNKDDIDYITPILLPKSKNRDECSQFGLSALRCTDFPDEVQVKGDISLQKLYGVSLPLRTHAYENDKDILITIHILLKMIEKYNYNYNGEPIPVVDAESLEDIREERNAKLLLEKYRSEW